MDWKSRLRQWIPYKRDFGTAASRLVRIEVDEFGHGWVTLDDNRMTPLAAHALAALLSGAAHAAPCESERLIKKAMIEGSLSEEDGQ